MAISRPKKEEIVKNIKDQIAKAKSLVFVRFHKLSVSKITELRKKFREAEAQYTVVKKSLLKLAFKESGKEFTGELEGEIALGASFTDELASFKTANDFAKKEKAGFSIVGGFFDGAFVDAKTAQALGAIPGRDALLAQLMSVIQGNTRKLVYVLDQLSRKGQ